MLLLILLSTFSMAATPTGQPAGSKLEKNISFDDLLVQGQYQFADESVTTVEQDKVLDALLQVRKDFKDKIKRSASRN